MEPKPYGTWDTIITEEFVIDRIANTIDEVLVDPKKLTVYRIESRPKEEGRGVLVRVAQSGDYPLTDPTKWNVGTNVHAYGGAAATVFDGTAYFSVASYKDNDGKVKTDGRVYKVFDNGGPKVPDPTPITPVNDKRYFAGLAVCPKDPKFIVAILEDHKNDPDGHNPGAVINELCVINVEKPNDVPKVIVTTGTPTDDFGPPAFSPNGTRIAWQYWKQPDMPWDQAKIYTAEVKIDAGSSFELVNVLAVPFHSEVPQVSLAYPNWSDDNTVIFTSDVSDFINPWKYDVSKASDVPSPVFSKNVDQDFGYPMWSLHFFPFAVLDETCALFIGTDDGHDSLYYVNLKIPGLPVKLSTGCVIIDGLRSLGKVNGQFTAVFAGTKANEATELIYITVSNGHHVSLHASVTNFKSAEDWKEWISTPITCPIQGNDGTVHTVFYKPKNPNYSGLPGENPPCIVHVHGGPEWLQPQGLDWTKQYFTSRGWAWLDVNYGGSTGYGRKYRERLRNRWGVVDTDDCISSVLELSDATSSGRHPDVLVIDAKRVCIRGGSAGGFTTYAALSYGRYQGVFAAGTSIYGGVADLKSLTTKAEKFELFYTQKFMGGTPQEVPWIYNERAPITYAADIKVPLMILHGEDDPVVPVEQAREMYKLAGPCADIEIYKGEGHHFGGDDHIKDALSRERDCYERALKLKGVNPI